MLTKKQLWLLGGGYLVLAVLFLVLYLPIVLIFWFNKEFRYHIAYRIMFVLGIVDCLQLLIHIYTGILIINNKSSKIADKIIGASFIGLYYATLTTMFFLSYNRFATVVLSRFKIFNSSMIGFVLILLTFLILSALYLLPSVNYIWIAKDITWSSPDSDGEISWFLYDLQIYMSWVVIIETALAYSAIFGYMAIKGNSKMMRKEWKISIQVLVIIVYFALVTLYWYHFPSTIFGLSESILNYISNVLWEVTNVINAFIYLFFNGPLREAYFYFWRSGSFKGKLRITTVSAVRSSNK